MYVKNMLNGKFPIEIKFVYPSLKSAYLQIPYLNVYHQNGKFHTVQNNREEPPIEHHLPGFFYTYIWKSETDTAASDAFMRGLSPRKRWTLENCEKEQL